MSDIQTAVADAPASDTSLPSQIEPNAVSVEPTQAQQEDSYDNDLRGIFRKHNPERDEQGHFKAAERAEEPAEKPAGEENKDGEPAPESVEQAVPAIDPPASLSREMREKWSTLAPDWQQFLAKRESESTAAISRLGSQAKAYEPIANVLEQNRDVFQARNVSYDAGVSQLIAAQRYLDKDPASAIQWLAKSYGVDLNQFAQSSDQSESDPATAALHQKIARLEAQLNQTSNAVQSREQQEAKAREDSILNEANSFFQDKGLTDDDYGPLAAIISAERALSPHKSTAEVLEAAYETFQYRSPERRQQIIAKQQAEAEATRKKEAEKKAAEAKKLGALNVKSAPVKGESPKTWDDDLRETYRRVNSR